MVKVRIALFILIMLLVFQACSWGSEGYIPVQPIPTAKDVAMKDDNEFLKSEFLKGDYFQSVISPVKKGIKYTLNLNMKLFKNPDWYNTHLLYWGDEHGEQKAGQHRFIGYNDQLEPVPNMDFPNEVSLKPGAKLDLNKWLPNPWDNSKVIDWISKRADEDRILKSPFDGKLEYRDNIYNGICKMLPKEINKNSTVEWEKYVHVLIPPTYYGWGWGRAWHDEGNGILYRTIPIAPDCIDIGNLYNLYVKNFNPGIPFEVDSVGQVVYKTEPDTVHTGTVVFGIDGRVNWELIKNIPIYAGLAHQIRNTPYQGVMKYVSGNGNISGLTTAYPFGSKYKTYQKVSFNKDKSEITVDFNWTARKDSQILAAGINWYPAIRLHYEDAGYEDNYTYAKIKVLPVPDCYVQTLDVGAKYTEPGKTYTGKVVFGLGNNFTGKVKAKLGLTHNGYPIEGIDGQIIELDPGQVTEPYYFEWHGQPEGQDSTIVAKIWPQEPTLKDSYWGNNSMTRGALSGIVDVAVTDIKQDSPAEAATKQHAEVTFKNNGTYKETFLVHYFVGSVRVKTETLSVAAGISQTRGFEWVAPSKDKTETLKVVADPWQQLPDINRSNNTMTKQVVIKDTPYPLYCENKSKPSSNWTEAYWIIVGHDKEGNEIWERRTVQYTENIKATVKIDTKQDIVTDPKHPKESDRESRGSWEIIPWAEDNGLEAYKVTRAGYGFELEVDTTYETDFENPDKVPKGLENTAEPIGGQLWGPQSVRVEFWDTNNRSVGIVNLIPISGDPNEGISTGGKRVVKWALPVVQTTLTNGKKVDERKHYTDVNIPDGKYYVTVYMDGIGKDNLSLCIEDYVTIYGDMYDDIYTGGNR